uniref:vomeronasal type-2 receptor 26-like n=1 Tax=Podarcis muralis TaxID=64176 RepID=UPI00109F05F8|nr:vomeronasal type-2 receptor 26-like [Podarcis muralis]
MEILQTLLFQRGICLAFAERTPKGSYFEEYYNMLSQWLQTYYIIAESKANAVVVYGEDKSLFFLQIWLVAGGAENMTSMEKVWIMTAQLDFSAVAFRMSQDMQPFHGSICFTVHSNEVQGFKTLLCSLNPFMAGEDGFLQQFWQETFHCFFSKSSTDFSEPCTGQEKLESLPSSGFEMSMTGHSYSVYNAVYVVAHALHDAMYRSRAKDRGIVRRWRPQLQKFQPWQLHPFLRSVSFNNSAGEEVSFSENRELEAGFDITNLVTFPNNSFIRMKVGWMNLDAPPGKEFSINEDKMVWHRSFHQVPPLSQCNKNCPSGTRRKKKEGEKFCCYDCAPCSEGKISYQKDMNDCVGCSEDHYPNRNRTQCIPKSISFLTLEEPLGMSLAFGSIFSSLLTILSLAIFMKHQDTPIPTRQSDLPSPTNGFCERMTYWATLELLSTHYRFVPNYQCDKQKNLRAVIGGLDFEISLHMAAILGVYKIPQLTYGSFAPEDAGQSQSTSFYRMVPNEAHQYTGIVELLLHFGWT